MLPDKEFGKLSPEQFHRLVKTLPELRKSNIDLASMLKSDPARFRELFGTSEHSWASIYEMPFFEQMSHLMFMLGMHEPLIQAWQSEDPLEEYSKWGEEGSGLDDWYRANESTINPKHMLWLAMVFQRNIMAIMLFHCSMGHLVERVRQNDDESFFHAVEVDRSVLSCPTFADRLARAESTNDKHFFIRLRKSLKGPSKKHMEAIQDLRYSIVALRAMGFDRFTDADLEILFIRTRLYPNSAGALKNLRKHLQNARKLQPPDLFNSGGRPKTR
jgi:hypothetical protein